MPSALARVHPVSLRQDKFFVREDGRPMITVLFLALLAIELTDVVFANDSIPAVINRIVNDDVVIDLGSDGEPVGYDIQHASQHPEAIAEALGFLHQRHAA